MDMHSPSRTGIPGSAALARSGAAAAGWMESAWDGDTVRPEVGNEFAFRVLGKTRGA